MFGKLYESMVIILGKFKYVKDLDIRPLYCEYYKYHTSRRLKWHINVKKGVGNII